MRKIRLYLLTALFAAPMILPVHADTINPVILRAAPCPQCGKMTVHNLPDRVVGGWLPLENTPRCNHGHKYGYDTVQQLLTLTSRKQCSYCGWEWYIQDLQERTICHGYD